MVTVRISSEEAGYLSFSQVIVQQMRLSELAELIVAVTGKDAVRVGEVLRRGVLVAGASRFRWQGWEASEESVGRILAMFPDPDPSLPFRAGQCERVVLCGPYCRIEILRETAAARRLLARRSYWDELMQAAQTAAPRYIEYSYKAKADCYRLDLSPEGAARLRDAARRLRYSALRARIAAGSIEWLELYTTR